MKKMVFCLTVVFLILAVSCKTTSSGSASSGSRFNSASISEEQYTATRNEVRAFIHDLNTTIRRRNYEGWKAHLSPEYLAQISSPQNLQQLSELPALKTRNIVLETTRDYFMHVVVPSRANSEVDDITFIGANRVQAFTISTNRNGEVQRLRLYDLERVGNTWQIIN